MLAAVMPMAANAESTINSGGGANIQTQARVDFSIVIPKIVFLRVGTSGGTIDVITFNVPAAAVGSGADQTATAGSGNLGSGGVNVQVIGNNGDMTLAVAGVNATLLSGTDTLPWSEILVATAGGAPAHPAVPGNVTLTATNKVVSTPAGGSWTYTYSNTNAIAAGTYTGRLVYTATTP
jgi:hypothetical protein